MTSKNLKWYHFNRYNALGACEHCQGIIHHEPWCMFVVPIVKYASEIVADRSKLTRGDALILHALGVTWDERQTGELLPDASPLVAL